MSEDLWTWPGENLACIIYSSNYASSMAAAARGQCTNHTLAQDLNCSVAYFGTGNVRLRPRHDPFLPLLNLLGHTSPAMSC